MIQKMRMQDSCLRTAPANLTEGHTELLLEVPAGGVSFLPFCVVLDLPLKGREWNAFASSPQSLETFHEGMKDKDPEQSGKSFCRRER